MEKEAIWHGQLADYWFDEGGTLHALSKNSPRTAKVIREDFELLREITEGKKVCVIIDNTNTRAYDIKSLKILFQECNSIFKAVAFVPRSSIGKMLGDISEQLNPFNSVPMRVFENTEEAKKWIRKFCP